MEIKKYFKKVSEKEFEKVKKKLDKIKSKSKNKEEKILEKYTIIKALKDGIKDVENLYYRLKKMQMNGELEIIYASYPWIRLGDFYKVEVIAGIVNGEILDVNEKIFTEINAEEVAEIDKVIEIKKLVEPEIYFEKNGITVYRDLYGNYYLAAASDKAVRIPKIEALRIKEEGFKSVVSKIKEKMDDYYSQKYLQKIEEEINGRVRKAREEEKELEIELWKIPHEIVFINERVMIIKGTSGKFKGKYFYATEEKCFLISEELAKKIIAEEKRREKNN